MLIDDLEKIFKKVPKEKGLRERKRSQNSGFFLLSIPLSKSSSKPIGYRL